MKEGLYYELEVGISDQISVSKSNFWSNWSKSLLQKVEYIKSILKIWNKLNRNWIE